MLGVVKKSNAEIEDYVQSITDSFERIKLECSTQ